MGYTEWYFTKLASISVPNSCDFRWRLLPLRDQAHIYRWRCMGNSQVSVAVSGPDLTLRQLILRPAEVRQERESPPGRLVLDDNGMEYRVARFSRCCPHPISFSGVNDGNGSPRVQGRQHAYPSPKLPPTKPK